MTKSALVTGANKGIGLETVRQLAGKGWKVVLGARDAEKGKQAVTELQAQGLDVVFLEIDLVDKESVESAVKIIEQEYPDLSLLINNAGMPGEFAKGFSKTTEAGLRNAFEVNFFGTFRLNQLLLPLLKRNGATIVNVSIDMASLSLMMDHQERTATLNSFDYNASKTANNAMTVSMALELKDSPAQVFAVTPGFTTTDLNNNAPGGITKEEAAGIILKYTLDGERHNGVFFDKNGVLAW